MVDAEGRLLGIDTNRLGDGFYLALPADAELRQRLDALGRGEATAWPRLGVGIAPARVARQLRQAVGLPERDGLLVRVVEEGGPADQAGLRTGDLLVEAGGRPLNDADELHEALDQVGEDQTLTLRVVRGTDELTVTVRFGTSTAERVGSAWGPRLPWARPMGRARPAARTARRSSGCPSRSSCRGTPRSWPR